MASPTVALAEDPTVSSGSDKLSGAFAGVILACLVAYSLWLMARPLLEARDGALIRALIVLAGLWAIKSIAVVFCPGFRTDVGTFEAWALDIAQNGPGSMYRSGAFLDYPPAYLYALWGVGIIARWLHASNPLLRVIIETPALAADFALGALIFVIVKRRANDTAAWLAMLFFALNPALLFDTVVWGQSDSPLALVLLLSGAMILENEFELGWGLAALALLIKPQALMLVPVLGLWTLLTSDWHVWWRSAIAFAAVVVLTVAPFQVSHPWSWLPDLYQSTAAYYHETSVNAFNLMALIGGLRQNDAGTVLGISYFALGITLLIPLYALIAWTLWCDRSQRNLWLTSFFALFGFFMLAPRMHERYIYTAIVFAIPLALQEASMLLVFGLLTLTGLVNLAFILHTLNTVVFLDSRNGLAMFVSMLNCGIFGIIAYQVSNSITRPAPAEPILRAVDRVELPELWSVRAFTDLKRWLRPSPQPASSYEVLPWIGRDTLLLGLLITGAAVLRFWHIWHPGEIVFDEVHFVGQARHYIHSEPFLDPHPPIAKLVIAAGIVLFGDHPWSWRLGNATLGTILIGVTYLLGRRMFGSRLAAVIAAILVATDGFFIVDSRIGCIDIVYLTFAAVSYVLLFRFIQTPDILNRRWILIPLGVVLGLCLGSKLYVPAVTFLIGGGFVAYTLWRPESVNERGGNKKIAVGGLLLTGSIAAAFYIISFAPHFLLGWWGGMADLFHYYKDVIWYEQSVSTATHPYASPWWSWPLMLRPVAYWQNFPAKGDVATIWGAGNPLTWWAVIPAMAITAVRAVERPSVSRTFLIVAFLGYYIIWVPIGRILFLYHYMPSVYIGYLALAAVLADMWNGEAEVWEAGILLSPLLPIAIFGIGHMIDNYKLASIPARLQWVAGMPIIALIVLGFAASSYKNRRFGRYAFLVFGCAAVATFIYFLPVWLGTPIPRDGYYARMWFQGPGLQNWI